MPMWTFSKLPAFWNKLFATWRLWMAEQLLTTRRAKPLEVTGDE
jgi:hypothetical protein